MNKLLGFFELKELSLPSVPWKEYKSNTKFDDNLLWTVRNSVTKGKDLNLPRIVGKTAEEAKSFANTSLNMFGEDGMVVYYPYFVAHKSGTLDIFKDKVVIEAVNEDLWNLVTHSKKDVTIVIDKDNNKEFVGNKNFLEDEELQEILSYVNEIRRKFYQDLSINKSVLLEWSFASNCDINKNPIGNPYLVFYELRTVS